jgi:hypothetical protein
LESNFIFSRVELEAESINLDFIVNEVFNLIFRLSFLYLVESETRGANERIVVAKRFDETEVSRDVGH